MMHNVRYIYIRYAFSQSLPLLILALINIYVFVNGSIPRKVTHHRIMAAGCEKFRLIE